jgi:hypothetical protein
MMAPVPAMTVAKSTTVHAVSATMPTVTTTPGRSRGDGGSGQSECGDSCERNLAKHFCILRARRDCLMRLSDVSCTEIVRNIFMNGCSGSAYKYWIS